MRVALIAVPILDHLPDDAGGTKPGLHPVGADAVRACPPYGVYLLADVLNAAGHDAVVVDLIADGLGGLDPAARCDLNDVDLIGVSATSLAWAAARDVIANVRRARPDVMIIAGGVHPSLFDSHCLATTELDGVIRGDGERPLAALCAALETGSDLASVPSLTWTSSSGQVVRNPDGPSIEANDLQRWFPDYNQLPHRAYFSLSLETSRGCAFDCSFCSTPHRRRWRGGEITSVVDRIEHMEPYFERAITRSLYLVDDEFAMNPPRARAIGLELSRRGLDIGLRYDCRAPDLLRDGLLEALAPHTHGLLVGAECGYDEGLKRIGKGVTCAVLIRAARRLAEAGLAERADFSFILGLPWEGRREVQRTVEFGLELARRHGVRVLFNWYLQLPGSRLWADSHIRGEAHESWFDSYGAPRDPEVFRSANHLSRDEIFEIAALVSAGCEALDRGVPRPEFHLPAAVSQAGPRGVPVAVGTVPVLGESTSRSDA